MVLAQVAAWMKADRGREVVVQGHADAAGDSTYNMDLSSRRARSVAEFLRSMGVARDRIIVVAEGERAALIQPAEGNRRVVIFASTVEVSSR
jgi:outer membrane protein OmpA-like peptidoglycan-associated protein